ncbi:MAG TPA: hypothetical protein ENJ82_09250 [Bacteroidetes bacterium]|nr:hypothetical protein [Bacteroidota bacterium]
MKVITFFALILLASIGFAQTDCKPYVPVSEGSKWEQTNYSGKGKETGKIAYELLKKENTAEGYLFRIKADSYDKKGKLTYSNTYDANCVNGEFKFDMAVKIDGAAMQSYQSMEVDVEASDFEIPSMDLPEGSSLEDGTLTMQIGSGGVTMFRIQIDVTNRKLAAKENMTTPAGTFRCMLITQDVTTKMVMKMENSTKEWYAEEVGMVRSESYNKKGKLMGYSVLTMLDIK